MTLVRIGLGKFRKIPIPVPPFAEQCRIVARLDELMALCDRLEAAKTERENRRNTLAAASLYRLNNGADAAAFRDDVRFYLNHLPHLTVRTEYLKQLRQTILDLAVSGRLVSQYPDDEPARTFAATERREKKVSSCKSNKTTEPGPEN